MARTKMDTVTKGLKRLPARFYRSESGRKPVREWLKSLDAADCRVVGEDNKDVELLMADPDAAGSLAWPEHVGSPEQPAARPHRCVIHLRRQCQISQSWQSMIAIIPTRIKTSDSKFAYRHGR